MASCRGTSTPRARERERSCSSLTPKNPQMQAITSATESAPGTGRRDLAERRARELQIDALSEQAGAGDDLDERALEIPDAALHGVGEELEAVLGDMDAAARRLRAQDVPAQFPVGRLQVRDESAAHLRGQPPVELGRSPEAAGRR